MTPIENFAIDFEDSARDYHYYQISGSHTVGISLKTIEGATSTLLHGSVPSSFPIGSYEMRAEIRIDLQGIYRITDLYWGTGYQYFRYVGSPFLTIRTGASIENRYGDRLWSFTYEYLGNDLDPPPLPPRTGLPIANARFVTLYVEFTTAFSKSESNWFADVVMDYITIGTDEGGPDDSIQECYTCPCYATPPLSSAPVDLQTGEKLEIVSDLTVNTPAGALTFTRSFRQSKRDDADFQFMGLGWIHNHQWSLLENPPGNPDVIEVHMDNGTTVFFTRVGASNRYQGDPGLAAYIDVDPGSSTARYTLVGTDQTRHIFDDQQQLRSRISALGEVWAYDYYTAGMAVNKLREVADSYGRRLHFSYIDALGQYDHLQAWRVGDHSANGLDGVNPTGRYVEFTFTTEKSNGVDVPSPRALLHKVKDARGQEWTYTYYGQQPGETIIEQLNFLMAVSSPAVDTTGDGLTDGVLTIKDLVYTLSGDTVTNIVERLGFVQGADPNTALLKTALAFQPDEENITTEETAGQTTTHVFANGVYAGPEDPANHFHRQSLDLQYRPWKQTDANGHATFLQWSADGKHLEQIADPLGHRTQFEYDGADRLVASRDAEGRETLYGYEDPTNPRQPTLAAVAVDAEGISINGNMETDSGWTGIAGQVPMVNERAPRAAQGSYSRYVVADAINEGIESTTWDLIAGRTYTITAQVYLVRGWVKMQVSGVTGLEKIASAKNVWQTVKLTHIPSVTLTGRTLQFVAAALDSGQAQFYVDQVSITSTADLVVNGNMELDSDWTDVGTPSINDRFSPGHNSTYCRQVVVDQLGEGIAGNSWDLIANRKYRLTAWIYAANCTVRMQVPSVPELTRDSTQLGTWHQLDAAFTPISGSSANQIQFICQSLVSGALTGDFFVDDVSLIEIDEVDIAGDMETDSGWTNIFGQAPLTNEWSPGADVGNFCRRVVADAVEEGIESIAWNLTANQTYLISAHVYPVNGSVRMQVAGAAPFNVTSSGTANWERVIAIYTPTTSASVKLQFVAATLGGSGLNQFYVDHVQVMSVLRRQEFIYGSLGRLLTERTIDLADETTPVQETTRSYYDSSNPNGDGLLQTLTQEDVSSSNNQTTTYFYDKVGRVVQTNQSSSFGSCTRSRTIYDEAGNVVATLCNFEPGTTNPIYPDSIYPSTVSQAVAQALTLRQRLYNLSDPDHYTDPNTNRLTLYAYDALGRRIQATAHAEDPDEQTTITVYDALNRVIRTITNYQPVAGLTEPFIAPHAAFDGHHGDDNTENLVADTSYNERNLVKRQTDVLGNIMLYGYDAAGRLIKTVQNASQPTYNNDYSGVAADPTLADYPVTLDTDQDIVTVQSYDAVGNLIKTIDPLGTVTLTGYDVLNRPVKSIHSASNPNYPIDLDPDLSGYIAVTDPDRDLIEESEYDTLGRVIRTKRLLDNRPTLQWDYTLFGYDPLGRQVRVIRSAGTPAYDMSADPDLSGYLVSPDSDKDLITQTVYDSQGRTLYVQDTTGVKTWYAYDGLGRQFKTIVNCTYTTGSPAPEDETYTGDLDDPAADIITQTYFDASGRVQRTKAVLRTNTAGTDLDWRWMLYGYDDVGRQVKVIRNASNPNYDIDNDPDLSGYVAVADSDQDVISRTEYDANGRVFRVFDTRGNESRYVYDILGRQIQTIVNYVDGSNQGEPDEDLITTTFYDLVGRAIRVVDPAGIETRYEYDGARRRVKVIANYIDGIHDPTLPDEDLISSMTHNKSGQMVSTTDVRKTKTTFTYDRAMRQLTLTQAADSGLAGTTYTCFDKAGRVLRRITNYIPLYDLNEQLISPDAKTGSDWDFSPSDHGQYDDRNLITEYSYDLAGRQVSMTDPVGNTTTTTYYKDGSVESMIDPMSVVTKFRYDTLRRRLRVVQSFSDQGEDPQSWMWDTGDSLWETSGGTAIVHGTDNDQNVIVDVRYDKAGRRLDQRDPRGNLTSYEYDLLDRRTKLTNPAPIAHSWLTSYENVGSSTRTKLTYPGLVTGGSYIVQRDFDRLGRLASINYNLPPTVQPYSTANVSFTYDVAGNRTLMNEHNGITNIRRTNFNYDVMRHLTEVTFDTNGDGSIEETVSYQYDAGGLRTRLTLPGDLSIAYRYDKKGQLIALTDWDTQTTRFAYDLAGRHIVTERANGLRSRYQYDPAGRLRLLRHTTGQNTLGHFAFEVDQRGNRTQTLQALPRPGAGTTTIAHTDASVIYEGSWLDVDGFHESEEWSASLSFLFFGQENVTLTIGEGPDHSIFDVYIGGTLWQSIDGYAEAAGERTLTIPLSGDGPHPFEIRNRPEKNLASSGYKMRFKSLTVDGAYDLHTIAYQYDLLSRLLEADYYPGQNVSAVPFRQYGYAFDLAGNRLQQIVTVGGTPTTTNYIYNEINQLAGDGINTYAYDPNGNLWQVNTVEVYTWDRANRLLSFGGISYAYDGLSNRISQTASSIVTKYLLDLQPGLTVVLGANTGANTERFVHGPRGIHGREDAAAWHWAVQDGLGSVRAETNSGGVLEGSRNLDPFGNVIDSIDGVIGTPYHYTGEPRDTNELNFHRARYLNPQLGMWVSLDALEGTFNRPMSLNGYSWVEGNSINSNDPSGMVKWDQAEVVGDISGVPFIRVPVVVGDCITCIAREGGLYDPQVWTPSIPYGPFGPFYTPFERLIIQANTLSGVLYQEDYTTKIRAFDAYNQPTSLLVPLNMALHEPYIDPLRNEKPSDCIDRYVDVLTNGLRNQGRCFCRTQCPPGVQCGTRNPQSPPSPSTNCDLVASNVRSQGVKLFEFGGFIVGGGKASVTVMWDANDSFLSPNYVVFYTVEAGLGAEISIPNPVNFLSDIQAILQNVGNLNSYIVSAYDRFAGNYVFSEAGLDQLTGLSGSLSASAIIFELGATLSINLSGEGCPVPATGGEAGLNFQNLTKLASSQWKVGASGTVGSTDILYDGRTNTLLPNGWWLPR